MSFATERKHHAEKYLCPETRMLPSEYIQSRKRTVIIWRDRRYKSERRIFSVTTPCAKRPKELGMAAQKMSDERLDLS